MESTTLQIILAIIMFVTTFSMGIASLCIVSALSRRRKTAHDNRQKWLSLMSCFSGGVLLGICFLDVLPEIADNYAHFLSTTQLNWVFPVPYAFVCIGFILVLLIEEVCFKLFSLGHGHTTLDMVESNNKNDHEEPPTFLKAISFAIAMSFHSIIEGFALGVQDTVRGAFVLFVSLSLHKATEAFSVGLQISKGNVERRTAVIWTLFIYSIMTPIGSILGAFLQASSMDATLKLGAVIILESCAAGTFAYVTFLEVIAHEKAAAQGNSLLQLAAIFAGFVLVSALTYVTLLIM